MVWLSSGRTNPILLTVVRPSQECTNLILSADFNIQFLLVQFLSQKAGSYWDSFGAEDQVPIGTVSVSKRPVPIGTVSELFPYHVLSLQTKTGLSSLFVCFLTAAA